MEFKFSSEQLEKLGALLAEIPYKWAQLPMNYLRELVAAQQVQSAPVGGEDAPKQ